MIFLQEPSTSKLIFDDNQRLLEFNQRLQSLQKLTKNIHIHTYAFSSICVKYQNFINQELNYQQSIRIIRSHQNWIVYIP